MVKSEYVCEVFGKVQYHGCSIKNALKWARTVSKIHGTEVKLYQKIVEISPRGEKEVLH